jgi:peptide/nickel transport system substrate-binding protein
MKRTLLILLTVLLIFSLVACGRKDEEVADEFVDTADAVETGEAAAPEPEPEPEPDAPAEAEEEPAEEPAEEPVTGTTPADLVPVDYSSGWELGKQGGELVRAALGDPKSLNGVIAAETSTTDVTDFLTAGAISRDQFTLEFKVNEGFGKSYEVSEDELSVVVEIEQGLKWSDGDDLTAEDIVFSLNHLMLREDVGSNSRSGYMIETEVDGYTAAIPVKAELIDLYTYKITLPTVRANLVELAGIAVYPMHIFGPLIGWDKSMGFEYDYSLELAEDEGYTYWETVEERDPALDYAAVTSFWGLDADVSEIVSAGPFIIAEYVPGQRLVLGRNPNYYGKDEEGVQLPYLEKVTYVLVEDQDTALARFLAGELDLLGLRGSDYAVFTQERLNSLEATLYDVGPVFSTQFLVFNQNPDADTADDGSLIPGTIKPEVYYWTSNIDFRMAMAHLVDRQTLINNVAFGFGYPQYSFVPRVSPYYYEGADEDAAKYDPEMAKDILDGLGWVDTDGDGWREDDKGRKIVFELTTNSGNTDREAIGTLFAEDAASVGIQVNFRPEDFNTMVGKLLAGQGWDAIIIGLTGSVDPISGSNVYPSSGNLHMTNPNQSSPGTMWEYEVDQAWQWANNTTDEEQRKEGFEIIQRIWLEQNPWIFTYNASAMNAFKSKFGNIYPRPIDGYDWKGILERIYVK